MLSCRPLGHVLSGPVKRLHDNPDPAAVRAGGGKTALHPMGLPRTPTEGVPHTPLTDGAGRQPGEMRAGRMRKGWEG